MYSARKTCGKRLAGTGTRIALVADLQTKKGRSDMYYDEESGAVSFVAGVLLGAVIGASLALLAAPQSGKKTRRKLMRAVSSAREAAGDRWDDLTDEVEGAVRAGRKRIRL